MEGIIPARDEKKILFQAVELEELQSGCNIIPAPHLSTAYCQHCPPTKSFGRFDGDAT